MSRRYVPDPAALAAALAGRVDVLETHSTQTRADVTALGRGLAQLTAQIRDYTASAHLITPSAPLIDDQADVEAEPQPDWMTVDDPATAATWLEDLTQWLAKVGAHQGLTAPAPCWPLHPDAVALLLALQGERDAAYDGQRPTPVTEWLTRWLPATTTALAAALGPCAAENAHRDHGHLYDATHLDHDAVATWWTTARHTPAPALLGLPPLD